MLVIMIGELVVEVVFGFDMKLVYFEYFFVEIVVEVGVEIILYIEI